MDRQILYATHSPYMVDIEYVLNGAQVARVYKLGTSSMISQPSTNTVVKLRKLIGDLHNPHTLGLDARETFFQDDGVIVMEGQEDVIHYRFVLDQLVEEGVLSTEESAALGDCFFGWGAGGATKVEVILSLLQDFGFKKTAAIHDNNERRKMLAVRKKFPGCCIDAIPADDVRTKSQRRARDGIDGLLDGNNRIRPQFVDYTKDLFYKVKVFIL